MRRVTIFFAAFAVAAVLAVPAFAATTKSVNWTFGAHNVSIKKNDSVKWTWSGFRHNLYGTGISKGNSNAGTATRKFTAKGKFTYTCTLHAGMKSVVTVS
ncbi:MAG: hypothetical protein F2799_06625 [Actinobacteria bacterium]|uniref:Unannotated protein n=1 Tax=freshwater metagenome TaxID=449393 RepID=A0A6J7EB18_9ZZZZ|nr:hypothetical protein [Actinomycetota bacterium]